LRFTDKIWIRQLTPWADRHQVSTPALTALLGHLVEFDKGDPSNVTLSNWTVAKQRKEGQIDESLSAELEEFGNDILVHWDEVSVKLGKNQGNSDPKGKAQTKHLFVTTTCSNGEKVFWLCLMGKVNEFIFKMICILQFDGILFDSHNTFQVK
jgi:hypothetical protein